MYYKRLGFRIALLKDLSNAQLVPTVSRSNWFRQYLPVASAIPLSCNEQYQNSKRRCVRRWQKYLFSWEVTFSVHVGYPWTLVLWNGSWATFLYRFTAHAQSASNSTVYEQLWSPEAEFLDEIQT